MSKDNMPSSPDLKPLPPIEYSVADAALKELADIYMPLKVDGVDDTEGLAVVVKARKVMKAHRIDIENARKNLKRDALSYGRAVDAEANRLKAIIEPVENHLKEEEAKVERERERIREAEAAKRRKMIDRRVQALSVYGDHAAPSEVEDMTQTDFEARLAAAMEADEARKEAERKRKEEEAQEAERRRLEAEVERERLETERAALAKERAELEAARAELVKAKVVVDPKPDEPRELNPEQKAALDQVTLQGAVPQAEPPKGILKASKEEASPAQPRTRSGVFMVTDVRSAADAALEYLSAYSVEDRAVALRMLAEELVDEAARLEQL